MPPIRGQGRKWCFTSFTDPPVFDSLEMNYLLYGNEVCPTTGASHFQGFVSFKNKQTFDQVKSRFLPEGAHIELCKGSPAQNEKYCKKEGDYKEFGTIPPSGQRNDLNLVKARLLGGQSLSDLMLDDDCASTIARHLPYFRLLANNHLAGSGLSSLQTKLSGAVLRPWQQRFIQNVITTVPSPRNVYWIWDAVGGTGKSFLCDYLCAFYRGVVFTHGKVSDIAHAYNYQPLVIFDLARTQEDKLDGIYMCLENFKNGRFFSPKYESHNKLFDTPHVLVLANFAPDKAKLSLDRWKITELVSGLSADTVVV